MPKRDVNYTEIICDRCGKKIQLTDKGFAYRHLVVITRYTQVWFGKLWNPKGRAADYYLCENCRDVLMNWLEGNPLQSIVDAIPLDESVLNNVNKVEIKGKKFVSVVRCGECATRDKWGCPWWKDEARPDDWYCADGKRREE